MTRKYLDVKLQTALPVAACVAAICCAASSADADDFTKRFYIGGGVGITHVDPDTPNDSLSISDDNDVGAHLALGYDISRFLTVEAYAATLGSASVEFLGSDVGDVDYTVFGLSALGYLFNTRSGLVFGDDDTSGLFRREGASLYGRIGIGHLQNDSDNVSYERDHPNHVAFGLGLEYGFENGIALRTEWIGSDTDAQYFNVGILKRFGSVAAAAPALAAATPVVAAREAERPAPTPAPEPQVFEPVSAPVTYFGSNSSDLAPEAAEGLNEFADQIKDDDSMVQIEGNTDWIAPEDYNMSLSVRRAESVANYLISRGVDRDRISTVGYGETRPASNNDTAEGRALNRRTEIVVQ